MKIVAVGSRIRVARPANLSGVLAGLCLLFSIAGLAIAQAPDASGPPSSARQTPPIQTNKIVLPQTPGVQLTTDRATYAAGQPVLLTFKVANTTKKPITYDFASGQQASFSITDAKGNPVWDSTASRALFRGITHLTLAPGESKTYQAVWNERENLGRPVPPGVYTVTARLLPMPRVVVSGGLIVNTETDPNNTGTPTKSKGESGATLQQNITPPVTASATVTISSAQSRPASHSGAAH